LELRENFMPVLPQIFKAHRFGLPFKSQEQNSCRNTPAAEDNLAEIEVIGYQNPLFNLCNSQQILVSRSRRLFGCPENVMPLASKPTYYCSFKILVSEESQRASSRRRIISSEDKHAAAKAWAARMCSGRRRG
jgi:hypothetical protein